MAKKKSSAPTFECAECGWQTVKWVGRCPECQAWGSVHEKDGAAAVRTAAATTVARPATTIGEVDSSLAEFRPTGVGSWIGSSEAGWCPVR